MPHSNDAHILYLTQALNQAKKGLGFCVPNPAVGALVVKNKKILASAYHQGPGLRHAERAALEELDQETTEGATIYVTLEPCSHWGRTPPCADYLIERGIKTLCYGFTDPNPAVSGRGIDRLEAAGITCEKIDLLDIQTFYRPYAYWWRTGRPWVTAKIALSLDGKIAKKGGGPTPITGEAALRYTHEQRKRSDAILTTARTILHDDPRLNARCGDKTWDKPLYLLDRKLSISPSARIFQSNAPITGFYNADLSSDPIQSAKREGVSYFAIPEKAGRLDWPAILDQIGKDGCHSLWVEAGGRCFESLIQSGFLNQGLVYIAPKVLGNSAYPAFHSEALFKDATEIVWEPCGDDVICCLGWAPKLIP